MLDLEKGDMYKLDLPFNISSLHPLSQNQFLVVAEPSQDPQQQVQGYGKELNYKIIYDQNSYQYQWVKFNESLVRCDKFYL